MRGLLRQYLRYTSWPILTAMIALMAMGVLSIHVLEQAGAHVPPNSHTKQMVFALLAVGMFVAATLVPYQRVGQLAYPLFAATVPLLIAVFLLPSVNGSRRWIPLGPVKAQPSELAKLAYVLMLAWYLRYRSNYRRFWGLLVPFVLTLLPIALILPEPDLGTSLVFLPMLYMMLFVAGAKLRHLLGIVAVATVLILVPVPYHPQADQIQARRALAYWSDAKGENLVLAAGLSRMEIHQIQRINGWLRQDDPRVAGSIGYQLQQSKMTLGAGGLTGRNDFNDDDDYFALMRLPEEHTDFIFAVIGGQWGLMGGVFVLALYAVIFLFGLEIATNTDDAFGRLLAVGVLSMFFAQIVINAGMTMGLCPVTGMTLPLISYGGSSLVVNGAALGLLVNVGQRSPMTLGPRAFEYDGPSGRSWR